MYSFGGKCVQFESPLKALQAAIFLFDVDCNNIRGRSSTFLLLYCVVGTFTLENLVRQATSLRLLLTYFVLTICRGISSLGYDKRTRNFLYLSFLDRFITFTHNKLHLKVFTLLRKTFPQRTHEKKKWRSLNFVHKNRKP